MIKIGENGRNINYDKKKVPKLQDSRKKYEATLKQWSQISKTYWGHVPFLPSQEQLIQWLLATQFIFEKPKHFPKYILKFSIHLEMKHRYITHIANVS